jgi:2,3-diketo-5-methylthio-1-phosphopentane phosphatase
VPSVLVLDFDGTVTTVDTGDAVCERFAPPAWREIDEQWVRHELSLPEAQRRMWALVNAERAEIARFLDEKITLRPGLDALLEGAASRGVEVWLASGGFDFYIEPLLGDRIERFSRRWYNIGRLIEGRVAIEFPHSDLACERCAICKGKVCDRARSVGSVLFAGDGHSDRCVAGRADRIAAVRGSILAKHLAGAGVAFEEIDRLDDLLALI